MIGLKKEASRIQHTHIHTKIHTRTLNIIFKKFCKKQSSNLCYSTVAFNVPMFRAHWSDIVRTSGFSGEVFEACHLFLQLRVEGLQFERQPHCLPQERYALFRFS